MIDGVLRDAARIMYYELLHNHLEVVLIPSFDPDVAMRGGKIRIAVSHNAQWYQEFCADYPKRRSVPRFRKLPDTAIKRAHTLRALQEIANGKAETLYAQRLLPVIIKRNGQYLRGEW